MLTCFNPRICKRCDRTAAILNTRRFVSIHASVKDATEINVFVNIINLGFNPRICKRCDEINVFVNIINLGFNPRICKRCDLRFPLILFALTFQSTHL